MSAGDVLGFDNVINSPVTTMLLIFDTLDFLNHRSHLVLQLSIIYGIKFRIGCRCLLVQVSPPRLPHTNLCWCGAGGFPESEQAADPYLQPQRLFILFPFLHTSYQDSLSSNSRSAFYHLSLARVFSAGSMCCPNLLVLHNCRIPSQSAELCLFLLFWVYQIVMR
jgi:hypothetical protein